MFKCGLKPAELRHLRLVLKVKVVFKCGLKPTDTSPPEPGSESESSVQM